MADDIYTGQPIVTPSDEHVILNALGGRYVVGDLIDRETNSRFGDTIDTALADALLPVRALLNALSGEGQPPPPYRGATAPDGTSYNILPGGKPEISRPRVDVTSEAGTLKIEGVVRSMPELRRMLGRTVVKHGLDMSHVEALAQRTVEASPRLNMRFHFTAESSRALVKMVCNLFAQAHRQEFMGRGFDAVRAFVREGTGVASDFIVFNTKAIDVAAWNKRIGPLDHVLVVRTVGREVTALVALYEHLQFVVRLGATEKHLPVATAYRVDQLGRGHRVNDRRDARLPVRPFSNIASSSTASVFHAMRESASRLLSVVMPLHRRAFESDLVERCMREAFGEPDGKPITPAMIESFSRLVAERWTEYLHRQGYFESPEN